MTHLPPRSAPAASPPRPASRRDPGRRTAAWVAALSLVLGSTACSAPAEESGAARTDAPRLVLLDSIRLQEGDARFIAEPGAISVGSDGTFYIADRFSRQVHAVSREGRFLHAFGRGGKGPGEFDTPGYLALDGDSLLYAADIGEIEVFDLGTRTHRQALPIPRVPGGIAVSGGRLFAALPDAEREASFARVPAAGGAAVAVGPFPALLREPVLFPMMWQAALAVRGDTAATAFTVTNHLYLNDVGGRHLDSIAVPARRRQGVDAEVLRGFVSNPSNQALGEKAFYGTSLPTYLQWMPGQRLALVMTDWGMVRDRFVDSSYLSVVDTRGRRSCVDARIPGPTDPPVRVALRGDTLFVLSQEVAEDGSRAAAVIRSYRIDTAGCDWKPASSPGV